VIPLPSPKPCVLLLSLICTIWGSQTSSAQSVSSSFELPPLDAFGAIVERPLFSPDRRPAATAAAPEAESPPSDESGVHGQILLAGTATDQGDRAVAILRDVTQGTQFRVWVGDEVGGWTIYAIKPREIVLENAKRQVTVTLDEPALPEPAVSR
jgi:hypothetical protein